MCGIIGLIGSSKDPKATYQFIETLLVKTQVRGDHATGWWGAQSGNGSIVYHKEPNKAVDVVKKEVWKKVAEQNPNLFIGHCRYTTPGVGGEKQNKNNHPHVSTDYCLSLVHNGKIPEYRDIKEYYDCTSECDSEILLRMIELQEEYYDQEAHLKKIFPALFKPVNKTDRPDLAMRLLGMKEIFSKVNYGAMAIAVAERLNDGQRALWLTRDDERPLHIVDMREQLGQIFFCSTPEIFRDAVEACPEIRKYIQKDKPILEFPSMQIWVLTTDDSNVIDFKKFKVSKTRKADNLLKKHVKKVSKTKQVPRTEVNVLTDLNEKDEPKDGSTFTKAVHTYASSHGSWTGHKSTATTTSTTRKVQDPVMAKLTEQTDDLCTKLSEISAEINTALQNKALDKQINAEVLTEYVEVLTNKLADLEEFHKKVKETKCAAEDTQDDPASE